MFNRDVRVFISGIMIGSGPAEASTHVQSSEPHVAQKFVAIPPDLDSLLNSQIQSALFFFATSIYMPFVIAAMHRVYFAVLFCTRLDAIAGPA